MIRLRSTRGYTLIELVIVMSLAVIFAGMVAISLRGLNQAAVRVTDRAVSQDQARQGVDVAAQALRGARPLGACVNDEDGQTTYEHKALKTCITPREAPFRLLHASPTSVSFFAYNTTTSSAPVAAVSIPDLITIGLAAPDSCTLVMTRRPALPTNELTDGSVSYTSPRWTSVAGAGTDRPIITLGTLSAASRESFFRYLDQGGDDVDPEGEDRTLSGSMAPTSEVVDPPNLSPFTAEEVVGLGVAQVATIEFYPVFTGSEDTDPETGCATTEGDGADFSLPVFADISSVRLQEVTP